MATLPAAPWLSDPAIAIASRILHSHRLVFGRSLIAPLPADASPGQRAQALFATERVVLAHDGADPAADPGPRLIYANRAALRLWRRRWQEMVGMPSRLTAEPAARAERVRALVNAQQRSGLTGYGGIRIDSQSRRFRINGASVWSLRAAAAEPGPHGEPAEACGQAACFSSWHWI